MSRHLCCLIVALAAFGIHEAAFDSTSQADIIKLVSGGKFSGKVLDSKSDKETIVLQRGSGEIRIQRSQIKEIIKAKTDLELYEEIRSKYEDTVEDQWKLVQWCESRKLLKLRREHLGRVVALDPDHEAARKKLGHRLVEGKWMTLEEARKARGLVRYQGRLMSKQEREIQEKKNGVKDAVKAWYKKVKLWSVWMESSDESRRLRAQREFRSIDDPLALEALVKNFSEHKLLHRRALFLEVVSGIESDGASLELVKRAIADEDGGIRDRAVELLAGRPSGAVTGVLLRGLKSDHNIVVRRSALALAEIEEPSTILPLINALVTKHKIVRTRGSQSTGIGTSQPEVVGVQTTVSQGVVAFRPIVAQQRASGIGIGNRVTEVIQVPIQNFEVLDALAGITDEDFGYDQQTWKKWYAAELRRRDELERRGIERPRPKTKNRE